MRDPFRGFVLEDVAIWGGGFGFIGGWIGYTYARIYNWAWQPATPEDPVYQAENGVYMALSVSLPVILVGHLLTVVKLF
jgi:hypothetical protein